MGKRDIREQKQLAIAEAILTEVKHKNPENWNDDEPLHTWGDRGRKIFGMKGPKRHDDVDDYREGKLKSHGSEKGRKARAQHNIE